MQIYLAAVYTNEYMAGQQRWAELIDNEKAIVADLPNILESYHYVKNQKYVDAMRSGGARVFLDSGAFSAYTLGVSLSVPEYCDYVKRNQDIIRVEDGSLMASVLDGIGDPLQTYRNQLEMEYYGVRPLPCFHFGEDERYLEWYIANYQYITIGGMVGKSKAILIPWLDRIWDRYLSDGSGRAKTRVHGFGITTVDIMERYPWYSCDSSSWIQATAFGSVYHPVHGPLAVSDKSPSRHDAGRHVSTFTPIERAHVEAEFAKQGFSYERLSTVYQSRAAYNLWAYKELNYIMNQHEGNKFKVRTKELW